MAKGKVSIREAVLRMDKTVESLVEGTGADVRKAGNTIGAVRQLIRLMEIELSADKAAGRISEIPKMDFIDYS